MQLLNFAAAGQDHFGIGWKLDIKLPEANVEGILQGNIEHVQNTEFKFQGNYSSIKSPINSGLITISSNLKLGDKRISLKNLAVKIRKLRLDLPELGLINPDIQISGKGIIFTNAETAIFQDLTVTAGNLPPFKINLKYSPQEKGSLAIETDSFLPVIERMAENIIEEFAEWDKNADLKLALNIKNISRSPKTEVLLNFKNLSAASPDGSFLVDGILGSIKMELPSDGTELKLHATCNSGEALLDTFYVNLNEHPFNISIDSTLPDKDDLIAGNVELNWGKICNLYASGKIKGLYKNTSYSGTADIEIPYVKEAFNILAVEPLSLGAISSSGQLKFKTSIDGNPEKTAISGVAELKNGSFNSEAVTMSEINSKLPFSLMLGADYQPVRDKNLAKPKQGFIELGKINAEPISISNLKFPLSFSSNDVELGEIPIINIKGGTIKLSELNIKNPLSPNFIFHGIIDADHINLLPFSPKSLPVNGEMSGDLEFWLLKDHLSTKGQLFGRVYNGEMTISEIFAENLFEASRQYGADFHVKNLSLEPLSKALDIGKITGRMDLDLTDLVVAYDQPATFKLHAITTPGSETNRDISLKAVNTLSVIGTGSGLDGGWCRYVLTVLQRIRICWVRT